ncbi:MAG: hypothetical protein SGPRY_001752 [Prymnesium sp.]
MERLSDPTAITADASGRFTLLGNGHEPTQLFASYACDSLVSASVFVAANLQPSVGDVDLGQSEGLQFQQSGTTLSVPVYGNSQDGVLVNYQIEVYFDPNVFLASACEGGALQGFTCTINDPLERVKLIASDTASSYGSSRTSLGKFSLSIKASAVTLINGTIVEFVRNLYTTGEESRTSLEPIMAGAGFADVRSSARRLLDSSSRQPWYPDVHHMRRRRLATSCVLESGCNAGIWGDINGDCRLTSYDALWAEQVIVGDRLLESLCPWARAQLDPTQDGQPAKVEDARYIRFAAANKYRFLQSVTLDTQHVYAGSQGSLGVTARVLDDLSEPALARTRVRIEIGYIVPGSNWNAVAGAPVYVSGATNGTAATGNWLAIASNEGDGTYQR